ncbi:hypothetical protein L6452_00973 [Arctium lappa]|uniref:Uncharacterized protein n=1 Tax=Arctium lappa TaxID=4217 RepID=A0ACB9FEY8_ARCLA|nr:hypothetical protein L6452_00973 [Arctium lappa]
MRKRRWETWSRRQTRVGEKKGDQRRPTKIIMSDVEFTFTLLDLLRCLQIKNSFVLWCSEEGFHQDKIEWEKSEYVQQRGRCSDGRGAVHRRWGAAMESNLQLG